MEKLEKEALQVSKEITIKFIETQRISPSNFAEVFPHIYNVVIDTIRTSQTENEEAAKVPQANK